MNCPCSHTDPTGEFVRPLFDDVFYPTVAPKTNTVAVTAPPVATSATSSPADYSPELTAGPMVKSTSLQPRPNYSRPAASPSQTSTTVSAPASTPTINNRNPDRIADAYQASHPSQPSVSSRETGEQKARELLQRALKVQSDCQVSEAIIGLGLATGAYSLPIIGPEEALVILQQGSVRVGGPVLLGLAFPDIPIPGFPSGADLYYHAFAELGKITSESLVGCFGGLYSEYSDLFSGKYSH